MRMNRRNVLVGLGTIVAGGGAALGTGAFSSVEADRTVNVSVEGDSSAFLQLDPSPSGYANNTDGTLQIDLDANGPSSGNGLNANATTTIGPLFTAGNESDGGIDLHITADGSASNITVNEGTAIENTVTDGTNDLGTIEFIFMDSGDKAIVSNDGSNSVNIAQTNTEDITLKINVPDINPSNIDSSTFLDTITIVANDDGT